MKRIDPWAALWIVLMTGAGVASAVTGAWLSVAAAALFVAGWSLQAWRAGRVPARGNMGPGVGRLTWEPGVVRLHVETESGVTWVSTWSADEMETHGAKAILAAAEARGGARLAKWCDDKGTRILVIPAELYDSIVERVE